MARSSASSLQKERGRPVRMGVSFFCTDRYIIPLTWEVQKNICTVRYRYPGFPMTHIDLAQAQTFLRQQANEPARKLRRQLTGAALFLLIAGGYGLYHAS